MSQIDELLLKWNYCYDQEDWYPPLAPALEGVTAEEASWRPQGEAGNTIWENVNHLLYFKERLLKRLGKEETISEGISNDDTFLNVEEGDEAWQKTVGRIAKAHKDIRDAVSRMSEEDLRRPAPNRPLQDQLHSLMVHDAYHTGQIILIRKLQGSWVAARSYL